MLDKAKAIFYKARRRLVLPSTLYRLLHFRKDKYVCPVCDYTGPFQDYMPGTGRRDNAQCPRCRSLERHRLQHLVIQELLRERQPEDISFLHFAPESFFEKRFRLEGFHVYHTADLNMANVDYSADLCNLPFSNDSYNFILASHILEHIPNDELALAEISRVLAPGGIALLPVPIVADQTVEYRAPNIHEEMHVRAPGCDYFDRYHPHFDMVEIFNSSSYPEKHQLHIFEDRSGYPTKDCPKRPAMQGLQHSDFVPVCYK